MITDLLENSQYFHNNRKSFAVAVEIFVYIESSKLGTPIQISYQPSFKSYAMTSRIKNASNLSWTVTALENLCTNMTNISAVVRTEVN